MPTPTPSKASFFQTPGPPPPPSVSIAFTQQPPVCFQENVNEVFTLGRGWRTRPDSGILSVGLASERALGELASIAILRLAITCSNGAQKCFTVWYLPTRNSLFTFFLSLPRERVPCTWSKWCSWCHQALSRLHRNHAKGSTIAVWPRDFQLLAPFGRLLSIHPTLRIQQDCCWNVSCET